jgi:ABC-type transport system substrate-binding protein
MMLPVTRAANAHPREPTAWSGIRTILCIAARAARLLGTLVVLLVIASPSRAAWNSPYPDADARKNILYSAFRERPKHLDPARAYSSNEYEFIAQIYEPPFQYHYLKRPYELIPLTAQSVPAPVFLERHGRRLPPNARVEQIAFSTYEIRIRPGIRYQPHAAFARSGDGRLLYAALAADAILPRRGIADFPETGTRELTAADYVYQIKRLAHPKLHSPILSVMQDYIVGLKEYATLLKEEYAQLATGGERGVYLDLTRYPLPGVEEVDRYTYRVKIHGKYPQFLYWMAMPFFAPMAPEVDRFFSQAGMAENNLTLDWYPVGTGAYMLTVNDPNRKMVLERNPNYHEERYPDAGEPGDAAAGLLRDAGKPLPFVDKVEFSLEKESIPYWNKFLQGYYDRSGVLSESFDQAVRFTGSGDTDVTDAMKDKGIRLQTSVATSTYYLGFNMLDSVVGGLSERARKLRQAISIAIDYEEQISIFRNGRGIAAQGPLPPGIFGYREGGAGINSYVYDWVDGQPRRKPIEYARKLLAEAGYPNGQDASGAPLVLHFETPATGPEEKAQLDWMRKQLAKLNVQLVVRATDYNRFQEKMRKGDAQLFVWGWNADYPDPENFLFLLYGPNKKVGGEGENAANYDNPAFNRLFERMKNMDNGPERLAIIDEMLDIVRRDAPWAWGVHPKQFVLMHAWMSNDNPNHMANNTLKYLRLDPEKRAASRQAWNRPVLWPIVVLLVVLAVSLVPAVITYRRRERGIAR